MTTRIFPSLVKLLIIIAFLAGLTAAPSDGIQASISNLSVFPDDEGMTGTYVKIISSSAESITLEFTSPAPIFETTWIDGQSCQKVSIPGLIQLDSPGWPALPVQGAMLGIPSDAQPAIKILAVENESPEYRPNAVSFSQPGIYQLSKSHT